MLLISYKEHLNQQDAVPCYEEQLTSLGCCCLASDSENIFIQHDVVDLIQSVLTSLGCCCFATEDIHFNRMLLLCYKGHLIQDIHFKRRLLICKLLLLA